MEKWLHWGLRNAKGINDMQMYSKELGNGSNYSNTGNAINSAKRFTKYGNRHFSWIFQRFWGKAKEHFSCGLCYPWSDTGLEKFFTTKIYVVCCEKLRLSRSLSKNESAVENFGDICTNFLLSWSCYRVFHLVFTYFKLPYL